MATRVQCAVADPDDAFARAIDTVHPVADMKILDRDVAIACHDACAGDKASHQFDEAALR
jgi:hypothetical protein